MKCAIGLCGHCQLGPTFICRDGPVFRYRAVEPLLRGAGAVSADGASRSSRCGSSPPATAASSACSTARTSCSPLAGEVEIAYFLEASRATVEGPYDLSLVEGSITTRARRRAHPRGARASRARLVTIGACATAAASRRCATSPTSTTSSPSSTRSPEYIVDARDLDADRRPRAGRLRAARLPDRQAPAARGDRRVPARAPARRSRAHSVCMECKRPRQRVRDGRPRHAVPRPGDARRLRRALPAPTTAAATAASGRWRRRTPRSLERLAASASASTTRDLVRVYRTFNAAAGAVPRGERGAMSEETERPRPRRIAVDRARARRGRGRDVRCAIGDGEVDDVELRIYEPPRFFEAFLRGRALHRAARHHRAHLRHLPGRLPDERVRGDRGRLRRRGRPSRSGALRRLLYCGEWIESHALHVYMLHAPGLPRLRRRGSTMARDHRERRRARACGSRRRATRSSTRSAAARSTRSTCASAASTARRRGASSRALVEQLERAREDALETVRWAGGARRSPTSSSDHEFVALRHAGRLPDRARPARRPRAGPRHRRRASTRSTSIEEHVPHSTALHSRLRDARRPT